MKENSRRGKIPALLASLLALLLFLGLMYGFLSNWGSVRVRRNKILAENGLQFSFVSYVQKSATDENPGPAVVVYHGQNDNAQGFNQWAVELIRRGYSVFIPDLSSTGMSDSGFVEREGDKRLVLEFAEMVKGFSFIDDDRVISTGHSKGGNYSYLTANLCDLAGGIAVSGMRSDKSVSDPYTGNLVTLIGTGDWMNRLDQLEDRNIEYFVNVYGEEYADGSVPPSGQETGSVEDGTYRVFETFSGVFSQHAAARYNPTVIQRVCYYAEKLAPTGTALAPENQVIIPFYIVSLLAVVSFIAVVINLALTLVKLPLFASVQRDIPVCRGRTGRRWAFSAFLSIAPTVPLFILLPYIAEQYFSASTETKLFPVGTTNRFLLYFLCIGIIEILLFTFTFYRREKVTPEQIGFAWAGGKKATALNIGKSLLLAAVVAGIGLTFLYLLENVFGMSFTAWWMMVRAASWSRVWKSLAYLPVFLVLFIGMQFGTNISRRLRPTGHEVRDMARDIVVNCLVATGALTIYFVINMICNDNAIFWNVVDQVGHSYYMYNFMLIGNAVTTVNTVLYRKLGTVWPGVWLCTILFGVLIPAGCPVL